MKIIKTDPLGKFSDLLIFDNVKYHYGSIIIDLLSASATKNDDDLFEFKMVNDDYVLHKGDKEFSADMVKTH